MPFDSQPTLTGELLQLRPLTAADFDALYAVASDPLIWEQHPDNDRHERDVFERFFADALDHGGALAATDRTNGAVIGSSRYRHYDEQTSSVEIGWTFLARRYWGGRYNREMKALMIRHAFKFVGHVSFVVGVSNLRSQKALENIGARRIGSKTDPRGRESYVYQITKSVNASD